MVKMSEPLRGSINGRDIEVELQVMMSEPLRGSINGSDIEVELQVMVKQIALKRDKTSTSEPQPQERENQQEGHGISKAQPEEHGISEVPQGTQSNTNEVDLKNIEYEDKGSKAHT
ncbi:hypothetical protein QVD17_12581 [Tagetes erecta]|uniref:Uncharacterized protein n=1 Tax=Tagetes erecta TaxID=13708 RepID=A0AAD8P2Z2_TARER|nr:hypothetical protein QVD17_12581 [Tagetes erecta]